MKITFKVKLVLLCFFTSCISIVVGGIGYYGLKKVSQEYDQIVLENLPKIHLANQMFIEYRGIRVALRTLGLPGIQKDESEKAIAEALAGIASFEKYEKEYSSLESSPEQKEVFDKVLAAWQNFKQTGGRVISFYRSGSPEDMKKVMDIFFHECPERAKIFADAGKALIEFHQKEVHENIAQAESASQHATTVSMLTIIAGFIFSITLGFIFATAISNSIYRIVDKLTRNVLEVTSASSEIAAASQELSEATTQQAASLQQTTASLEQISAMIAKASENANVTSDTSTHSQEKAEGGRATVEEMLQSMGEINDSNAAIMNQINQSNAQMSEIVKVIQEIGNKTTVINDIVFQTKLLSFNASVEAARAGEHGKGFAVVAEEVGNLAQMSGNAAKEISDMLGDSIAKVDSIVKETKEKVEVLVKQGEQKVQQGARIAQECSSVLEEIVSNVTKVSTLAQEISQAGSEQTQGVSEINKAMAALDTVTQNNTAATQSAAKTAESLSSQAESLKVVVSELTSIFQGNSKAA